MCLGDSVGVAECLHWKHKEDNEQYSFEYISLSSVIYKMGLEVARSHSFQKRTIRESRVLADPIDKWLSNTTETKSTFSL